MAYVVNPGASVDPQASGVDGLTLVAPVPGRGLVRSQWGRADPLFMVALGLVGQRLPVGLDALQTARLVAAGLLLEGPGVAAPSFRPTTRAPSDHALAPTPPGLPACGELAALSPDALGGLFAADLVWASDPRSGFALPFAATGPASHSGLPRDGLDGLSGPMRRDGFVHLPPLFEPAIAGAAAAYYEAVATSGGMTFDAATRRLTAHDEPLGVFWHHAFTPLLAHLVGEPVRATFSYVAAYVDDAVLPAHTDRDACTWTLSWMLAEDTAGGEPWPLWVRDLHGVDHPLPLRRGEGALMRGQDLVHWRDPIGPGRRATLLIFCWVPGRHGSGERST